MAGALGGGPPALVVNLGGGDVAMAEELLDLDDVHAGVEEEGGGGRPEGVGSGCWGSTERKTGLR